QEVFVVPDDTQISGYAWTNNGAYTNGSGCDGLFVATNGNGGAYVYYTTGGGGTAKNSIVRLTDSTGYNQPITIISSNLIYTPSASNAMKGLTFVPQQTSNAPQPTPTPLLTAQTGANVSGPFSITNTPDDAGWRGAITTITVNGSPLPLAAYDKTQ